MSKTNLHETGYLKLVFQNIAHANIGNLAGLQPSGVAGNFFIALFTGVTIASGETATVTETSYTGYARMPIARSIAGFTVSGNTCNNTAAIIFPKNTGTTVSVVGFGIYTALTGGDLISYGLFSSSVLLDTDDTPQFPIGQLIITED